MVTVPDAAAPAGRLRVLAVGVPTPGGTGVCVGAPLSAGEPASADPPAPAEAGVVAVVPPGLRYDEAAARLRALLAAGTRIGAVLVAGDEGVLVANRLPGNVRRDLPVIDQVDAAAAAACRLLAVEVRPPGHTLRLLADPVALGARLGLARGRGRRRGRAEPGAGRPRQRRRGPAARRPGRAGSSRTNPG